MRSHKLDGIGVGRIRTFPFLPTPFTRLSDLEAEAEEPTNHKAQNLEL